MDKNMQRLPIEVGITYVNKTWFSKRTTKKPQYYVIGFFQRGGKAIIKPMPDNNPETIKKFITESVEAGTMLYAEENLLPSSIKELYEVSELNGNRVKGDIHVNNVKNMWRDLKRVIKQTHIQVSQKHLELYCGEIAWRINNRHLSDMEKFELAISQSAIVKKRTYEKLIK